MKERLFIAIITLTFGIVSCENKVSSTSEQSQINETNTKSVEQMNSYISIFEPCKGYFTGHQLLSRNIGGAY